MSKVIITFTVDWEGEDFEGVKDLIELRKFIGEEVPATYFICPSYYTKLIGYSTESIKSCMFPGDEIGLHVHCFRSLIDAAGVEFRDEPDFFEPYSPGFAKFIKRLPKILRTKNTGRGVPISAYNKDEIIKVLNKSNKLLINNLGLDTVDSFRAGGWMASDNVFEALQSTCIKYDSSAAPPEILSQNFNKDNQGNMLDDHGNENGKWTGFISKIWGFENQSDYFLKNSLSIQNSPTKGITRKTQPYKIGEIIEMPNNCGVSDFASARKTMRPILEYAIDMIKQGREEPFFINIGCHQEGDYIYKRPIADFFNSLSDKELEFIEFKTLKDAGRIAKKYSN